MKRYHRFTAPIIQGSGYVLLLIAMRAMRQPVLNIYLDMFVTWCCLSAAFLFSAAKEADKNQKNTNESTTTS